MVTVFFIVLLTAALVKYLIARRNPSEHPSTYQKVLLVWFFVPYLAIFFLSFKLPMFLDRYLVFTSIAFYFLVGQAIIYTTGSRKIVFYVVSVIAVGGMLSTFKPNLDNHRRLKKVVEVIHDLKKNNTSVFMCPEWLEYGFSYYYNPVYFRDYGKLRLDLQNNSIFPVSHPDEILHGIFETTTSVILLEEWPEVVDKNNEVLKTISDRFSGCKEINIPEAYKIYYFTGKR